MTLATWVDRLLDSRALTRPEAGRLVDFLADPERTDTERVALLVALRARPETTELLVALASALRERAIPFVRPPGEAAVDLCGSGGAPRPSFNVSTVSAFVVRAAGLPVVKHGNRSSRGPCGSSDLLEAMGFPTTTSIGFARATYRRERIAFLHAPLFHPATARVATARRLLGLPTVFNRLGPLVNPARPSVQVVGTPSRAAAVRTVEALARLGCPAALAMTSDEGCDEFSPRRPTHVVVRRGRRTTAFVVYPERYLRPSETSGDWGALPAEAAAIEARRILDGGPGARRGSVVLTSGAALWLAGRARTLADGVRAARDAIDSGRARAVERAVAAIAARRRWEA